MHHSGLSRPGPDRPSLYGDFIASPDPNDLYCSAAPAEGANHPGIDMMACCPPEGTRTLWEAWANTVTQDERGTFVNMSFDRETPELKVISSAPDQGRLTVVARRAMKAVHLRPPSWAPRGPVRAYRNGHYRSVDWWGDYVRFENVKAGEELTITYPLISFAQRVTIPAGPNGETKSFVQHWVGNTIVDIEPRGTVLPIFSGKPPKLPPPPM